MYSLERFDSSNNIGMTMTITSTSRPRSKDFSASNSINRQLPINHMRISISTSHTHVINALASTKHQHSRRAERVIFRIVQRLQGHQSTSVILRPDSRRERQIKPLTLRGRRSVPRLHCNATRRTLLQRSTTMLLLHNLLITSSSTHV